MLYVDLKYISLVGSNLRNFKQKNKTLFNCSCPICGDSERKRTKARGFFYQHGTSMFYKCHNCAVGMSLGTFLKSAYPNYYNEYVFEKYKHGVDNTKTKEVVLAVTKVSFKSFKSSHVIKVSELDDLHFAKQYVIQRQIPKSIHSKLYFTSDFAAVVEETFPGKYTNLAKDDARLVIPFFDKSDNVIGLQGRSFSKERSLRYVTIRAAANVDLIYGLDRVVLDKPVYVVEGPIDSMFLPNCVAAANSDLASAARKIKAAHPTQTIEPVLIYDNEPRNKEIVTLLGNSIEAGHSVCIWPKNIHEKDINDIILQGTSQEQLCEIIKNRTFSGLQAKLEFSQWKKL